MKPQVISHMSHFDFDGQLARISEMSAISSNTVSDILCARSQCSFQGFFSLLTMQVGKRNWKIFVKLQRSEDRASDCLSAFAGAKAQFIARAIRQVWSEERSLPQPLRRMLKFVVAYKKGPSQNRCLDLQ